MHHSTPAGFKQSFVMEIGVADELTEQVGATSDEKAALGGPAIRILTFRIHTFLAASRWGGYGAERIAVCILAI
jgi:hypothetical protein